MKHIEKAESKHLDKIITDLREGKYVIPDFQREFEWNPWDVNGLIASIFMDYYIGTLLLWKASDENVNILSCEGVKGFTGKLYPEHIVLDGQQRLTAMYFAFFNPKIPYPKRKNRCYFFMDIKKLMDSIDENAFYYSFETKQLNSLLNNENDQFEKNIFPLEIIGQGSWGIMDWLKNYESYWKNQLELHKQIEESELNENDLIVHKKRKEEIIFSLEAQPKFTKILKELLSDYNISYIELDRNISIDKVCDIFTNINSKGVPLNIFDLLNAILRPHGIYLKDLWRSVEDELSYTDSDKMKIYIFQVMSILEQNYCSSKYLYYLVPGTIKSTKVNGINKKDILIKNSEEFLLKWNNSVESLKKTIKSLRNPRDFGAINSSFVPYPSIIPAFTAIKKHVELSSYKNMLDVNNKIKKWYWSSIFTLNYSSSVESTSAKDFVDLKKWFVDDTEEPENYIKFVQEIENQDFKKQNQKGSAIYNAIFNILILNEARDWQTFELPEYENIDDHHIVPHSWGKKHVGNEINSILNRTPLSPSTNRHIISDRMPNVYLKEMFENNSKDEVYKILESHLISKNAVDILLRNPFTKEDYFDFINEREKSVKNFIKSSIISDKIELPKEYKEVNDKIEKVELKIRDLIASQIENYSEAIPSAVQDKVARRIENTLKKNPYLNREDFSSTRSKLDYFDLQEYCDVFVSSNNWEKFITYFNSKPLLMDKFSKLGELRNSIRHSRNVSEVALLEGQAAILWFSKILD